jgi:hypothetical protein
MLIFYHIILSYLILVLLSLFLSGYALAAASNGHFAVGAPGHSMHGERAGAVYIFDSAAKASATPQKFVQELDATSGYDGSGYPAYTPGEFGISVALSQEALVVGADFAVGASEEESGLVFMKTYSTGSKDDRYVQHFFFKALVLCLSYVGVVLCCVL